LSAVAELLVTFGVAFHFFVAGNRRHLKFNLRVEHSKSKPTDDNPSLKWAWPRRVTCFYPLCASDARVIVIIVYLSVCLFVFLCVYVSHGGIVSKLLNVGSRKQHHMMVQGL